MTIQTLTKLVKSLSGPEKRYFKLYTRKQAGSKDYISLFDIIDKSSPSDTDETREAFRQLHPESNLNNTSRYLAKVLTDSLIQSKSEKDNFFQHLQELMRVKVLQERSISEEAHQLLKKIRKSAVQSQQYIIEYLTYREELTFLSDSNFNEVNDKTLVETQMKAKDILKMVNHIQDHHSLLELLKYRLVHSGRISSDDEKKRLNDLMLSEMILVTGKSKNSFAAQKLHLLFQSLFFTDVGDYQSALKTFRSLDRLFEQNMPLLDKPPLDYLSALDGILDTLHTLKKYEEIGYYIDKLKQLDNTGFPEYFRYQVRKTIAIYRLAILTGKKDYAGAVDFIKTIDTDVVKMYSVVNEEKQSELYFFISLAYFGMNDWKRAHAYISEFTRDYKILPQFFISKAIRLLNIIIHYQKGDSEYLEYESRSYKRFFRNHHSLESEKIILKYISLWPDDRRKGIPQGISRKLSRQIEEIRTERYEKQLLKYFDFTEWIELKLSR